MGYGSRDGEGNMHLLTVIYLGSLKSFACWLCGHLVGQKCTVEMISDTALGLQDDVDMDTI